MAAIFADDIFKCIFMTEKFSILIKNLLNFIHDESIDN